VIAANGPLLGGSGFDILGSATVAANNTYTLNHLPDDVYYPLAILDTNHDGTFDPGLGDAIGGYGISGFLDTTQDSVVIAGGTNASGINFALFDASAIVGSVTYSGTYAEGFWVIFVGLFDTDGFTLASDPVAGTIASWPGEPQWGFNTAEGVIPDDEYYLGAFIDVNENGEYDPLTDPAGFWGGLNTPISINVVNGADFFNIVIPVQDPLTVAPGTTAVKWPVTKRNAKFERLCEAVRSVNLRK
jgi:hypothetical protein